jgi:hypothetical protein
MNKSNNDELLDSFKLLWSNRKFDEDKDSLLLIQEIIVTDLKDELAHPRTKTTPYKKFYQAVKRITESNIQTDHRLQIIKLYLQKIDEL